MYDSAASLDNVNESERIGRLGRRHAFGILLGWRLDALEPVFYV